MAQLNESGMVSMDQKMNGPKYKDEIDAPVEVELLKEQNLVIKVLLETMNSSGSNCS